MEVLWETLLFFATPIICIFIFVCLHYYYCDTFEGFFVDWDRELQVMAVTTLVIASIFMPTLRNVLGKGY